MAGRGHGQGHGQRGDRGPRGADDDQPTPVGQDEDPIEGELTDGPGRSEQSPGHLKKAAGAQSARDFAPGRARRS